MENKNNKSIIPGILLIIGIIMLLMIMNLSAKVDRLEDEVISMYNDNSHYYYQNLQDELEELKEQLKSSDSLISDIDIVFDEFNMDTMTYKMKYNIALKEFGDETIVTVEKDGFNFNVTKNKGIFTAEVELGINESIEDFIITINDSGINKNESVSLYDYVEDYNTYLNFYDYMYETVKYGSGISFEEGYDKLTLWIDDVVVVNTERIELIEKPVLYIEVNGEVKKTFDYIKEKDSYVLSTEFNMDYNHEDNVEVYLMMKDANGLTYKFMAGSINNGAEEISSCNEIYKDGKLVLNY